MAPFRLVPIVPVRPSHGASSLGGGRPGGRSRHRGAAPAESTSSPTRSNSCAAVRWTQSRSPPSASGRSGSPLPRRPPTSGRGRGSRSRATARCSCRTTRPRTRPAPAVPPRRSSTSCARSCTWGTASTTGSCSTPSSRLSTRKRSSSSSPTWTTCPPTTSRCGVAWCWCRWAWSTSSTSRPCSSARSGPRPSRASSRPRGARTARASSALRAW